MTRAIRKFDLQFEVGDFVTTFRCFICRDGDQYPWKVASLNNPWTAEGSATNSHQAWKQARAALTGHLKERRKLKERWSA